MSVEKKEVAGLYMVDGATQDMSLGLSLALPKEQGWVKKTISPNPKEKWWGDLTYFCYTETDTETHTYTETDIETGTTHTHTHTYTEKKKSIVVIASPTRMDNATKAAIPYFDAVETILAEDESLRADNTYIIAPEQGFGIFESHIAICYQAPGKNPVIYDPKINNPEILLRAALDSLNSGLKKVLHVVQGIFRALLIPTYQKDIDVFAPIDLHVLPKNVPIPTNPRELNAYKNSYIVSKEREIYYVTNESQLRTVIIYAGEPYQYYSQFISSIDLQKPGKISLSTEQIENLRGANKECFFREEPIPVHYETLGTQSVWDPTSCGFHFFANAKVIANSVKNNQPVSRKTLLDAAKDNPQLVIEAKEQLNNAKLDAARKEAKNKKDKVNEGCDLYYRMEQMPENLEPYRGSYILAGNELTYVREDKSIPVPTQTANIDKKKHCEISAEP